MATKQLPFSAIALYEYKSDYDDDLNFLAGQVIEITAVEDQEWYSGTYTDANGARHSGMFPKNFVNEVEAAGDASATSPSQGSDPALVTDSAPEKNEPSIEKEAAEPLAKSKYDDSEVKDAVSPVNPVIPKEFADAKKLKESIAGETSEKPFNPKGLSSRITTYDNEKSFPLPSAKLSGEKSQPKSFKGATSSYIPPSLGSNKESRAKPDFSHSSYVPPPLKNDKPQPTGDTQTSEHPEIIKSSSFREEAQEEEGPKLSLKERIALLQQKQKEQAEREADALKKKHHNKESQKRAAPAALKEQDSREEGLNEIQNDRGESLSEHIPMQHSESIISESAEKELTSNDNSQEEIIAGEEQDGDEEEENQDGDEEEEDEDSEESRRAALRERMAKLSGAGMYGFNPFGAAPGFSTKSGGSSKKKSKPVKEEDETTRAAPIPIMPFGTSGAPQLPNVLQRSQTSADQETEEAEEDLETEVGEDKASRVEEPYDAPALTEDFHKKIVSAAETAGERADNESFISASESVEEGHSLSERLTQADTDISRSKNLNSESAIEGDDEQEKYSNSEEDVMFSDREKERREKILPHIPDSVLDQNVASDYTTGYETDDDTQAPVQDNEPKKELSLPKGPPPPPVGAPQIPSRLGEDIQDNTSEVSREIPPVPAIPVPPTHRAAPLPPIMSTSSPSTKAPPSFIPSIASPSTTAPPPPFPSGDSPSAAAPSILSKSHPHPPIPSAIDYDQITPSKPQRRASSIISSRSTNDPPPPIPQSPVDFNQSPKFPNASPPVPGIKTASTTRDIPLSPDSPAPSPTMKRAFTSPYTVGTPQDTRGSISSAGAKSNLDLTSGWWLNGNMLPPSLQSRVGKDLIFEVDEQIVNKRGRKQLVLKDYYALDQDNSQTILHVVYDPADPQSTVNITRTHEHPPTLKKAQLDEYANNLGTQVFQVASRLVTQSLDEPLVSYVLSQVKGALKPVGLRSYGAVIYTNSNNTEVNQIDDFKPGDIIAINKAKFNGHNKLHQKIVYDVGSSGAPFAAVITEYDDHKKKFRVIEKDSTGKVKHSSYKPSDMKSGKIKVFRVVGRDFVNWN